MNLSGDAAAPTNAAKIEAGDRSWHPGRLRASAVALVLLIANEAPGFAADAGKPDLLGEGCRTRLEAMWDCGLSRLRMEDRSKIFAKQVYWYQDLPADLDEIEARIAKLCSAKSIYDEIMTEMSLPNASEQPVSCYFDRGLLLKQDRKDRDKMKALASAHIAACVSFYRDGLFRTAIERLDIVNLKAWKQEICQARFEQEGDFYHDKFGRRAEEFLSEYIVQRQARGKDQAAFLSIARLHSRAFLAQHHRMGVEVFAKYPELAEQRIRETYDVDLTLDQLREMSPESYFVLWLRNADEALLPIDRFEIDESASRYVADGVRIQALHFEGAQEIQSMDEQAWWVTKEDGEWRIKGLPAR